MRVAVATEEPAGAAVRASLVVPGGERRDHPIGSTWASLERPLTAGACAELRLDGDSDARVAIAQPAVTRTGTARPWVIIYVFDTLRFDQLVRPDGALYDVPAYQALASDSLLFTRAFSNSSWTRPSVASLLTGLGPASHGVYDFGDRVRADVPRLASELAEAGYRTVAVSTNPNVLPAWRLATGFDAFVDVVRAKRRKMGLYGSLEAIVGEQLLADADAPLFLYVHDNGPHDPYSTPKTYTVDVPDPPAAAANVGKLRRLWVRYSRAVRFSSARLAALVASLRGAGRYDDAIVVVVGDHGEAFGEHGRKKHGTGLSGAQIHVPLFLKAPRARGLVGRVAAPVSLAEVAPTVLQLLDLTPPPQWAGRGLPLEEPTGGLGDHVVISELDNPWASAEAVIRWPWKYLRNRGTEALFHLVRDPHERRNLARARPGLVAALRARLADERRPGRPEVVIECVGGPEDAMLDLVVTLPSGDAIPEFEGSNFEPSDRIARDGDGLRASLTLAHRAGKRGAATFSRDRDVVRLVGVPGDELAIRIRGSEHVEPTLVDPSARPLPTDGTAIRLSAVTLETRPAQLPRAAVPRCRLYRILPAVEASDDAIPDDVAARLRALGYL